MSGYPVQPHNLFDALWEFTADSPTARWQDDPRLRTPEGRRAVIERAEQSAYEDYARPIKSAAELRFRV